MKQQLRQARQLKEESAAELVLEATLEAVMEAVIRSAAAGAELLEIQEVRKYLSVRSRIGFGFPRQSYCPEFACRLH